MQPALSFLRRYSLVLPCLVLVFGADIAAAGGNAEERRIIVNDDGEVLLPRGDRTWDDYLGVRFRDAVDTQVDTYVLCVGATDRGPGIRHSVQSSMAYWASEKPTPAIYREAARRYIRGAHDNGMEIFASIRMNDVHDRNKPGADALTYPLKVEHPDLLLGRPANRRKGMSAYPGDAVMQWFWPGLNWAKPRVRDHFLDFIADSCKRFDFDGLELDFFRHPLFFRFGESDEHLAAITTFIRRVRETLDAIGRSRGRPYLLAVRIPDTPTLARRTGLDVGTWLEEDLVDLLVVGGGYMPYSGRLERFVDLAHRHGVPAYPCLNHFRGPVQMRTVASNFWWMGGDGFYLFNYFGVTGKEVNKGWGASHARSLREVGAVDTLRWLPKRYKPAGGPERPYIGYNNRPGALPVRLIDGAPVEVRVGDDIERAAEEGRVKRLRLRVEVTRMRPKASVELLVNGARITAENIHRVGEGTFTADLRAAEVHQGTNTIRVLPGPRSIGRLSSRVTGMTLSVQYKR